MSNTDNIRKMYSKIIAPEDAIKSCLDIENKKVVKFPVKRVVALAACLSVLLAVAIPVGANKIYTAFEGVEEYGSQYPQKTVNYYRELDESSLLITEGSKLTASAHGLTVKVQEAYFDGAYLYISFAGEYENAEGIDRFFYNGSDGYVKINGEFVKADITGYSFSLFNSEAGFAGVLGFIYPTIDENLEVEINIPYLEAVDADFKVIDTIDKSFDFSFCVKKSAPSTLVYNGNASKEEVSFMGLTASKGGVCVEIFVPESEKQTSLVSVVTDEKGNNLGFILGNREKTEGGYILKHYFEPSEAEVLSVSVYDKNNMEKGALTVFENIEI